MQSLEKALANLTDEADIKRFLIDLCTPTEIRALTERWYVAQLLHEGTLSYRAINEKTGISTTTIARVARFLKDEPHGGYRDTLATLKEKRSND